MIWRYHAPGRSTYASMGARQCQVHAADGHEAYLSMYEGEWFKNACGQWRVHVALEGGSLSKALWRARQIGKRWLESQEKIDTVSLRE